MSVKTAGNNTQDKKQNKTKNRGKIKHNATFQLSLPSSLKDGHSSWLRSSSVFFPACSQPPREQTATPPFVLFNALSTESVSRKVWLKKTLSSSLRLLLSHPCRGLRWSKSWFTSLLLLWPDRLLDWRELRREHSDQTILLYQENQDLWKSQIFLKLYYMKSRLQRLYSCTIFSTWYIILCKVQGWALAKTSLSDSHHITWATIRYRYDENNYCDILPYPFFSLSPNKVIENCWGKGFYLHGNNRGLSLSCLFSSQAVWVYSLWEILSRQNGPFLCRQCHGWSECLLGNAAV